MKRLFWFGIGLIGVGIVLQAAGNRMPEERRESCRQTESGVFQAIRITDASVDVYTLPDRETQLKLEYGGASCGCRYRISRDRGVLEVRGVSRPFCPCQDNRLRLGLPKDFTGELTLTSRKELKSSVDFAGVLGTLKASAPGGTLWLKDCRVRKLNLAMPNGTVVGSVGRMPALPLGKYVRGVCSIKYQNEGWEFAVSVVPAGYLDLTFADCR